MTRTDEARVHLRDRPGNDVDRAALDASLRFSSGLGAKSSCEVKNMQRRTTPWRTVYTYGMVKGDLQ
jgi:hypothetical protein